MRRYKKGYTVKPFKITYHYVYVVYEGPSENNDNYGKVHGVYINEIEAYMKFLKVYTNDKTVSHVAILKKPLCGKSRRLSMCH